MSDPRIKRLEKAQIRVLFTVPFFAPGVAKLPVVFDETVQTAQTDGKEIRWGTAFFDKLSDQELVTVLCHEVGHCMLGHLWRAPSGVDWEQWNIATDHAINLMLKEFSGVVMGKRLADPFPFPDPQDAYCADPAYAGLAEEVIYQRLGRKPDPKGGGPSGKQGGPSGKGQGAGMPTKGNSGANPGVGNPAPGSMPSFGDMIQPKPGSNPSSGKKLANDWAGTLIQACQMANGRGELPAGMERFVDQLLNPVVPWWELLRTFLREQCADDWDCMKPDPMMDESGFMLPSLNSEKLGPVVFATDTSGSINNELLARFQKEKQTCLDDLAPASLVDIYCDSKIHKVKEYKPGEVISKDAPGGGGTAFEPVWDYVAGLPVTPKCIVYLTDLDGSFGEDPGVPVLWVTWTKGGKAPFGEVVYAGN